MLIPTRRAYLLAAMGLLPAGLAIAQPGLVWVCLALDVAVLALTVTDGLRVNVPITAERTVGPVLSSGRRHEVKVSLRSSTPTVVRGRLRDEVMPGPRTEGTEQPWSFTGETTLRWHLTPLIRGDLHFGDLWLRVEGPWGLCARERRIAAAQVVQVFPDLVALTRGALELTATHDEASRRRVTRRADGGDFESLREYRRGDDRRSIDWKASARRGRTIVRQHRPERNQTVLLMLDCGRHMAGAAGERRKLDHAVDAALRLAAVSLDAGDQVGVVAFGHRVISWLPPRTGREHLRAIAHALYRVEATLTESDVGAAIDLAFSRNVRRALVVVLTDLLDVDSARALVARAKRLTPRHVPLVCSLRDDDVHHLARRSPQTRREAFERFMAARLEHDVQSTVAKLRDAGAQVVRVSANELGAAAATAYLDLKARGRL